MVLTKAINFKVIWTNLKCDLNLGKKIFKKQSFFKNLRRKITFSKQKTIKSLMFVVEKTYPVNNPMFKIDIENTRTQGAKYVQSLSKLFLVWMIFIIFIIFIVFMICRKIGIWCTFWVTYRFPYAIRHNDAGGCVCVWGGYH